MILKTMKTIITGLKTKPRVLKTGFFLWAFLLLTTFSAAQTKNAYNLNELQNLFEPHQHEIPRYAQQSSKPKNELEFLMASGFNIYKTFISSQDNPSCVFYPSCSEYTVQSLQQFGLFMGTLRSFDRLSRCHRLVKPNQYYFNPTKQRFYDPVR